MLTFRYDYKAYQVAPTGPASDIYTRIADDHFRDGYQNLGSGGNTLALGPSSANLKINAQGGNDFIDIGSTSTAAQGNHTVYGGTGDDIIQLGSGHDTIFAGSDDDTVEAGLGNDVIYGGQGNDHLFGDSFVFETVGGNDQLFGGTGQDNLIGMRGADEMRGGTDADTFVFLNRADSTTGARDHVLDFNLCRRGSVRLQRDGRERHPVGQPGFDFVEAASSKAGTIWATGSGVDWTVFVNVDGGGADMAIDVTLAGGATRLFENRLRPVILNAGSSSPLRGRVRASRGRVRSRGTGPDRPARAGSASRAGSVRTRSGRSMARRR
jgi:hypothetical protein